MSDTPRTDAECGWYDPNGIRYPDPTGDHVDPDFARQLERELAAANERIRRLEEAGKELRECAAQFGYTSTDDSSWISRAERAVQTWDMEAKP